SDGCTDTCGSLHKSSNGPQFFMCEGCGYTHLYWLITNTTSGDKSYSSYSFSDYYWKSGTITVTYSDVTIEVPNNYTVTFDSQSGTNNGTVRTVTYDSPNWNAGAVSSARSGYKLQGWYTGTNGTGTKVYDADGNAVNCTYWSGSGSSAVWKGLNNITLYAYWVADNFTQTLYFYKGSTRFDTKTYSIKNGDTFSPYDHRLDAGTPSNYHYSSVSKNPWTVTEAASASVYFAIDQMKVIYDGNGATGGSTSGVNIDYGLNLTVASNGFSKTNFHFLNWNTKSDGSGTSYSPGATIRMSPSSHGQEYRLYAIWERDTYTQTINYYRYEYNNGTWSWVKDKTVTYTAGAGLTFNAASKAGAETISGYYYDHIDTGSWTVTGAATANAYFMPNTYRVSYNGNGATGGSMADTTGCTYSVPFILRGNGFSKTYYTFNGWNTRADGTGTSYSDSAQAVNLTTVKDGTAVLYAQWKDTTAPTVSVSAENTGGNWVLYTNVTITASDNGDGLSPANTYRYCLCQNSTAPEGAWNTYTNKAAFSIGAGLTGTYYLYVAPVTDKAGNISSNTYHKYGPYLFDNSAPADSIQSVYGWYESATEVDFGIHDDHSGIRSIVIRDFHDIPVANITSSGKYTFDEDGENFYSIVITDNLGNTTTKAFMVKLSKHEEVIPKNAVWKGLDNLRVYAKWSPITYNIVFDGNGATSGSTAAMRDLVYDTDYELSANGFLRENYSFEDWNTRADGTGLRYADGQTVSNLSDTQGDTVTLYAQWSDISAPKLDVNPSSCSDIVRNLDVTITVDEKGSGLDSSNSYEYGLSASPDVPPDTWNSYMDGTAPEEGFSVTVNIGSGLDGTYYLWVKQIKDSYGNTSVSDTCTDAVNDGVTYHVCGTYSFDNTAPAGTVKYTENNSTLGLYNETITDSPYAVMSVCDAEDNLSGMRDITLEIWDAANEGNRTALAFVKNGTTYTCIFDLYNCLLNPQDIEKVRMRILATDNVGNTGSLQITSYDFGVMQTGMPISAECIGYREVNESHEGGNGSNGWIGSADAYVYERDAFRVEAYIENISHHSAGTTFMGGHFGRLRIYTFGYVEIINADFGSLRNFIKPAYDTEPNLPFTGISTSASAHLYSHLFKIPLYCEPGFFTDASVCGYKKNTLETRNVEYEVSDRIINHIKTILKYNVR
ncbi:MAG: InlB B-repeat-containing protein, partial [Lachnospiraceae bacterium]